MAGQQQKSKKNKVANGHLKPANQVGPNSWDRILPRLARAAPEVKADPLNVIYCHNRRSAQAKAKEDQADNISLKHGTQAAYLQQQRHWQELRPNGPKSYYLRSIAVYWFGQQVAQLKPYAS